MSVTKVKGMDPMKSKAMQRRLQTNQRRQALYAAFVADVEADNFEDYLVEQIHELSSRLNGAHVEADYWRGMVQEVRTAVADDDE